MISDIKIKNGFLSKDALPLKTVPTQEALAMAVAAQRINGAYIKDTRRFSEPNNKTQFSNKEIVKFFFAEQDNFTPEDVIVVLLHDSGSRYLAKIYNDEWMKSKKFILIHVHN